jgi:hypothetical protein
LFFDSCSFTRKIHPKKVTVIFVLLIQTAFRLPPSNYKQTTEGLRAKKGGRVSDNIPKISQDTQRTVVVDETIPVVVIVVPFFRQNYCYAQNQVRTLSHMGIMQYPIN